MMQQQWQRLVKKSKRSKRLLLWFVPLTTAVIATSVFSYGFVTGLRGGGGRPVGTMQALPRAAADSRGPVRVLLLGDSVARGTGDESGLGILGGIDSELDQRKIVRKAGVNLAINGARTADLAAQIESRNVQHLIAQANVIVVSIGGNDLFGSADWRAAPPENPDEVMDRVLGRIEALVRSIRQVNPSARVFILGLYNPFVGSQFGNLVARHVVRWNSKLAQSLADDVNVTVVQVADLFSHHDRLSLDRFHPGKEGYRLIGRRIAESL